MPSPSSAVVPKPPHRRVIVARPVPLIRGPRDDAFFRPPLRLPRPEHGVERRVDVADLGPLGLVARPAAVVAPQAVALALAEPGAPVAGGHADALLDPALEERVYQGRVCEDEGDEGFSDGPVAGQGGVVFAVL